MSEDPLQPPLHPCTWSETGHTAGEGAVDRALFENVLARLENQEKRLNDLANENAELKTKVANLEADAQERANPDPVAHFMRERANDLCRRQAAVDEASQKLEEAETQDAVGAQCRDNVVQATEEKQAKEAERDRIGEEYKNLLMEMEGGCTGYLDALTQVMNDRTRERRQEPCPVALRGRARQGAGSCPRSLRLCSGAGPRSLASGPPSAPSP